MRYYTPITKDIRTKDEKKSLSTLPRKFYGNQYEMSFDIQSDFHLRSLLRRENKSSLNDFING